MLGGEKSYKQKEGLKDPVRSGFIRSHSPCLGRNKVRINQSISKIQMESGRKCEKHSRVCETFCFQCHKMEKPMCPICLCEHNAKEHSVKNAHITEVIQQNMEDIQKCLAQTAEKEQKIKTLTDQVEAAKKEKETVLAQADTKLKELEAFCQEQRTKADAEGKLLLDHCENIMGKMRNWEEKLQSRKAVPERLAPKLKDLIEKQNYWEAYDEVSNALVNEVQLNEQEVVQKFEQCDQVRGGLKKQLAELEAVDVRSEQKGLREQNDALSREVAALKGAPCCSSHRVHGEAAKATGGCGGERPG